MTPIDCLKNMLLCAEAGDIDSLANVCIDARRILDIEEARHAEPPAPHMTAEEFLAKFPEAEGKHPSDEQESDSLLLDMACPECGKEIETQQNRAAASRWSGMTPEQRSREMKRVRKKGLAGGKKRLAK